MSQSKRIETMIVARDEFTRAGLRAVLSVGTEVRVMAEMASNEEAVRQAARLRPDVAILDGALADGAVVESCRTLRARAPRTRVVVLIDTIEPRSVVHAVRAGAEGCIAESSRPDEVRRIVREVAAGEVAFDPQVTRTLLEHLRRHPPDVASGGTALTPAECRALRLVAAGKTNREIACDLAVSEKTVKNWLAHAFGKLHVTRRAEAAVRFTMPHAAIEPMWAAELEPASMRARALLDRTA